MLARHSGKDLRRLKSMVGLESWNRFFNKDPTHTSHHPELQSGVSFMEMVTLSRGQHSTDHSQVPLARQHEGATRRLDALKAKLEARL